MPGRFQNLKEKDKRPAFIELMIKEVGKTRFKAITTLMARRKMSFEQARKFQAKKIIGKDNI